MKKKLLFLFLLLSFKQLAAQDTLTFMFYNLLSYSPSVPSNAMNLRGIVHSIRPDILAVNEISDDASATDILSNVLNDIPGYTYQRALFTDGPDKDNMLFYNAEKISLQSQDTVQTSLRLINEYRCFYNDPEYISQHDTVFFTVYSAHLKASSGSENEAQRYGEVLRLKSHLSEVSGRENLFFGGDFNLYTNTEPAYVEITAPGEYPFFDPINTPASWHDNPDCAAIHTQSTRTRGFGGGATGGLDDRFDFILVTRDVMEGSKQLRYIPGSYQAYGNDGLHLNDSLTQLPVNPGIPDSVTQQLYKMSDHLPVILKTYLNFNAAAPGELGENDQRLEIFPNPASDRVQYRLPFAFESGTLELCTLSGTVIKSEKLKSDGIRVRVMDLPPSFAPGVYLLRLTSNLGLYSARLIILPSAY